MDKMTITLPDGLKGRAHAAGFNVSGTCARAIERAILAIEKEAGTSSAKITAPAVSSQGVTS